MQNEGKWGSIDKDDYVKNKENFLYSFKKNHFFI